MTRQRVIVRINRHPNTQLRLNKAARDENASRAARQARDGIANQWLEGSLTFDGEEPLHKRGKLDYDAAKSAVERGRALGLIS